ncbi:virulence RhuM family protein [Serratia proteamaculans]|uniref:virulence RhuM family protein n=1 Tax=Serratia proteamaculans TaxID=28151 RepID=UPI00217A7F50|nr:virulence RhuM family protein [Serratia proteamaculans]CAI1931418.1 Virulence protein [Serratia proteamaculans]CAI1996510.1 Virulence protein [Serratia proteamaculans]
MSDNDLILYTSEDGQSKFILRTLGGQVWLTQLEIAELYQTSKQNIGKHVKSVITDGELAEGAVVNRKFTTGADGKEYLTLLYSLPMIISVGYRVRSTRGTQFRQWATQTLGEYMLKGFAMDDERLKDPKWDYFDELLERIRDIRSSELRFYQKIRDLFTLSEDYRANEKDTGLLFAEAQNKLFFAVTGYTAAELVVQRADTTKSNMNLMSFKGSRVRKADVVVAKNYLNEDELDSLNRLASMFFEFAEFRAKNKQHLKLADWRQYIDNFMAFNEQPLLNNCGSVSREQMKSIAHQRYESFDQQRKMTDACEADRIELEQLEQLEKRLKRKNDR